MDIIKRMEHMKRSCIPLGLLFGLLGSQMGFVLVTAQNGVVGHGVVTQGIDAKIQASVTFQAKDYKGAGTLISAPRKLQKDMRPDRAIAEFLTGHHPRHGSLALTAADGSKLSCEMDVDHHDISGHCSDGQQTLLLKPEAAAH